MKKLLLTLGALSAVVAPVAAVVACSADEAKTTETNTGKNNKAKEVDTNKKAKPVEWSTIVDNVKVVPTAQELAATKAADAKAVAAKAVEEEMKATARWELTTPIARDFYNELHYEITSQLNEEEKIMEAASSAKAVADEMKATAAWEKTTPTAQDFTNELEREITDQLNAEAKTIKSDISKIELAKLNKQLSDDLKMDIIEALQINPKAGEYQFKLKDGTPNPAYPAFKNAWDWKQTLEVKTEGFIKHAKGLQYYYSATPKAGYVAITEPVIVWGSAANGGNTLSAWIYNAAGVEDLFADVMHGGLSLSMKLQSGAANTGYHNAYQCLLNNLGNKFN